MSIKSSQPTNRSSESISKLPHPVKEFTISPLAANNGSLTIDKNNPHTYIYRKK